MQIMKFITSDDQTPRVGVVKAINVVAVARGDLALTELLHSDDADRKDPQASHRCRVQPFRSIPFGCSRHWTGRKSGAQASLTNGARLHASKNRTGRPSFYDLVYRADRPELFFKATPSRVVGPGQPVRVRRDSNWCVPEPELAFVLSPTLALVGFTAGNDMSARDIEGENPLYLPQAKLYDSCCALGPVITLAAAMPPRASIGIQLDDRARRHQDSSGRNQRGPHGSPLRGTDRLARARKPFSRWRRLVDGHRIVPPDDFSLRHGDMVRITIDGIGTLSNPVIQGPYA